MPTSNTKKNHMPFFAGLALFALACFVRYFRRYVTPYVTTMYLFNYEDHGYISRGLLGTLYQWLDEKLINYDLMNYEHIYDFAGTFTVIYLLCLFWFYKVCMKYCQEENRRNLMHLIIFLSIFAFPMFVGKTMYGGLDLYINLLMVLCMILIVKERFVWLIIPIGMICMGIEQNFIFSNANIIFVLLLYKIILGNPKKRVKYISILTLFFLTILALFIYFEFYSISTYELITNEELLNETVKAFKESAKLLSESGLSYNKAMIEHELLGLDITLYDVEYQLQNMQDFPVFVALFSPYIYYGFRFFFRLIRNKEASKGSRFMYLAFLLGGATTIPLFLFKVNYGTYIFNLLFYYVAVIIAAFAMDDKTMITELDTLKQELKRITPMTFIWFLYPFLLTPFKEVTISTQIHDFAEILFSEDASFFLLPGMDEALELEELEEGAMRIIHTFFI